MFSKIVWADGSEPADTSSPEYGSALGEGLRVELLVIGEAGAHAAHGVSEEAREVAAGLVVAAGG